LPSNSSVGSLKQAYASTLQGVGRVLTRTGVMGETAPPLSQRRRHWAYSLTRVHNSLAIAELDVPWWTYDAIDAVTEWIAARERPIRAFEYGSGASTFWLARRVDQVYSTEHHLGFGEMMTKAVAEFDNVALTIVEPVYSTVPAVPSAKEGHANLDFSAYVAAIDAVEGQFDMIIIDGRAREACARHALPRLAPGGLIIFDNSARRRYHRAIAALPVREQVYRGLTPTLPYPDQTSLLSATGASSTPV
jgi:predicted O-methyltransferase YrrM